MSHICTATLLLVLLLGNCALVSKLGPMEPTAVPVACCDGQEVDDRQIILIGDPIPNTAETKRPSKHASVDIVRDCSRRGKSLLQEMRKANAVDSQ